MKSSLIEMKTYNKYRFIIRNIFLVKKKTLKKALKEKGDLIFHFVFAFFFKMAETFWKNKLKILVIIYVPLSTTSSVY